LLAATSKAAALGIMINCGGFGACGASVVTQLVSDILGLADATWATNGRHIACAGRICAFLQNTGGAARTSRGSRTSSRHGCASCRSVPYLYAADNNVADGELAFDFVANPTCNGLC
ncbi:killer toxin, partial [Mycena rosella]